MTHVSFTVRMSFMSSDRHCQCTEGDNALTTNGICCSFCAVRSVPVSVWLFVLEFWIVLLLLRLSCCQERLSTLSNATVLQTIRSIAGNDVCADCSTAGEYWTYLVSGEYDHFLSTEQWMGDQYLTTYTAHLTVCPLLRSGFSTAN